MTQTRTYAVTGMSCDHCKVAITQEVAQVRGIQSIDVDLEANLVHVSGTDLDDGALVAAIDEAGYDAVPA